MNQHITQVLLPIVGISNYVKNYEELAENVGGQHARLQHEPTNPYDQDAIIVTLDGLKVGYVSSDYSERVHRLLGSRSVSVPCQSGGHKEFSVLFPIRDEAELAEFNRPYRCQTLPIGMLPPRAGLDPLPQALRWQCALDDLHDLLASVPTPSDETLLPQTGALSRARSLLITHEQVCEILRLAQVLLDCFGYTLCNDDVQDTIRVHLLLQSLLEVCDDTELRQQLSETSQQLLSRRKHLVQGNNLPEILREELDHLTLSAIEPEGLILRILRYHWGEDLAFPSLQQRDQLRQQTIDWLDNILDGALRGLRSNPPQMARKLRYCRLSRTELYKVYAHLILLRTLDQWQSMQQGDSLVSGTVTASQHNQRMHLMERAADRLRHLEAVFATNCPFRSGEELVDRLREMWGLGQAQHTAAECEAIEHWWTVMTHRQKGDALQLTLLNVAGLLLNRGYLQGTQASMVTTLYPRVQDPDSLRKNVEMSRISKILQSADIQLFDKHFPQL